MPKLGAAEIQVLAQQAGVNNGVEIAVAIALAESGGKTDSHNQIPPDDSYGLWQINMFPGAHTTKELGISKKEDLFNPVTNANAMAKISKGGTDWTPWTTYTNQKYKLFLGKTAPDAIPNPASSLSNLADKVSDGHFWARIGEYILGFILILIGIVLIVGMGKVKQVTNVVNKVTA